MVELRGVSKSYREGEQVHAVLRGADFSLAEGEIAVLLGRSGSGKSTLLNLVGAIDLPDAGEVRVAGRSLGDLDERGRTLFRRASVGFVFQFFNLVPTLTALENVQLPLELNGRLDAAGRERARALLDEVGLLPRAASFPDRLSGGEQQRVAIARALAHDPPLLLADEPTGNLDLETGRRVLDLLDRLARGGQKTMIMVTHSPDVVGLADRVFTLHEGRLIARAQDRRQA